MWAERAFYGAATLHVSIRTAGYLTSSSLDQTQIPGALLPTCHFANVVLIFSVFVAKANSLCTQTRALPIQLCTSTN